MNKDLPGFVVYRDLLKGTQRLSDAELGRLFRAMMQYAFGEEEMQELTGREVLLFDMAQAAIDRDSVKYESKAAANRENGKRGGRPRKQKASDQPAENQPSTGGQPVTVKPSFVPFMSDEEAFSNKDDHEEIFAAAVDAGMPENEGTRNRLIALYTQYGKSAVLSAIKEAIDNQATKALPYITKILEEPRKPKKQEPEEDDYVKRYGGYL